MFWQNEKGNRIFVVRFGGKLFTETNSQVPGRTFPENKFGCLLTDFVSLQSASEKRWCSLKGSSPIQKMIQPGAEKIFWRFVKKFRTFANPNPKGCSYCQFYRKVFRKINLVVWLKGSYLCIPNERREVLKTRHRKFFRKKIGGLVKGFLPLHPQRKREVLEAVVRMEVQKKVSENKFGTLKTKLLPLQPDLKSKTIVPTI